MTVSRHLHAVVARRVVYELRVLGAQPLQPRRQLHAGGGASDHDHRRDSRARQAFWCGTAVETLMFDKDESVDTTCDIGRYNV